MSEIDLSKEYAKRQAPAPQPTAKEMEEERKKQFDFIKAELPFLRAMDEYQRLQLSILQTGVQLGQRSIDSLPGTIRWSMEREFLEDRGYCLQIAMQMEQMKEEREAKEKQWSVVKGIQYTYTPESNSLGQIHAWMTGVEYTPNMDMTPKDPTGKFTMLRPDSAEMTLTPGDWVVLGSDDLYHAMTNESYMVAAMKETGTIKLTKEEAATGKKKTK